MLMSKLYQLLVVNNTLGQVALTWPIVPKLFFNYKELLLGVEALLNVIFYLKKL